MLPSIGSLAAVNLVLVACGSFNPITRLHLDLFRLAKQHLDRRGGFRLIQGNRPRCNSATKKL